MNKLELLIKEKKQEIKEYIDCGCVRPYYFLDYIDRLIEETKDVEERAWLLEYKSGAFDEEYMDEAESDLSDLEFEFREAYPLERFADGSPGILREATSMEEIREKNKWEQIIMGVYPYGKKGEMKELVWDVLKVEEDRMLVITHDAIDRLQYNHKSKSLTWEDCSLREWLNEDFIKKAFTEEERERILTTSLENHDNCFFEKYPGRGGNDTEDKIFALSHNEVYDHMLTMRSRVCTSTDYAYEKGISRVNNRCDWWLRTPGCSNFYGTTVEKDGSIFMQGFNVAYGWFGVRPAMWIDLT